MEKVKRTIISHTGRHRSGYGPASNGYSHLVELECGHREFVKNSIYKGIGSKANCDKCAQERWDKEHNVTRIIGQ